ncbi:MAG: polysaccharide biosynthesis C-terminal domain-containing protein, partial [Planctomycetales bacterium]|nr:polysaccharide biosynthesis C-terminal domain-containing protein [Planctomycetales bacterium]
TALTTIGLYAASAMFSVAAATTWCLVRLRRKRFSRSDARTLARVARPLTVVNVLGVTSQRIDILLVGLLLSASDVGVYALATRFAEAVMLIPGAVAFVSLSRSASGERAELRDTTPRVAWASGIAAATTGISAVALSWLLSSKYLPSGFHEVPWVCAILVPGIVALAMSQVLENELVSIGGMRATVAANASSLVVVVIVAFPTILLIGLDGAAIASTCGFIARYASTVRSYLKLHELDARRYFLSSRFWRSIP